VQKEPRALKVAGGVRQANDPFPAKDLREMTGFE
jgi:hypothetical protein